MVDKAEEHRAKVLLIEQLPSLPAEAPRLREFVFVQLIETLADYDEEVAEHFLAEQEIDAALLKSAIRRATLSLQFSPGMPLHNLAAFLARGAVHTHLHRCPQCFWVLR